MSGESEATAKLAPCPHCGESHDEDSLRCPSTDMLLPLEGRRLDGKFRFLSALGSGGMASVYLAVNERVDREVAIKFLRPEVGRDTEAVARFRSEAKAAGRIGNTHICEILDLGESPIGPYIVMERLRGIDLAALIRRQTRLAPGYAVRVVRHALEGLAAAHEAGIVHRDLKPGNVFLHRTDGGDTIVKLMDFGVSKFLDGTGEAETASGILLGTPEYMAPEQLEGAHKIGPPADIWAMGAILYRAITGHQVFSGPNLAAVLKSMALDEVTPLSSLVKGVPPELEAVIHRCLERDVSARYPSTQALSDALAPFEEVDVEVVPIPQPSKSLDMPISVIEPAADADADENEIEIEVEPVEGKTQQWEDPPTGPGVVKGESDVPHAATPKSPKRTGLWVTVGVLAAATAVAIALLVGGDRNSKPTAAASTPAAVDDDGTTTAPADGADDTGETGALAAETETGASTDETGETETGETDTDEAGETGETGALTDEFDETGDEISEDSDSNDDDGGEESYVAGTDRPPPSGTLRGGPYITPRSPAAVTDHSSAKKHCDTLAAKSYAGVSSWSLASPPQLRKFIGSEVKRSRYWTTALHDGRALVFSLPQGKKSSEKAGRKIARPLCVAKY